MKNNRGFSIIELVIVVAVVAVALTLVLGSFGSVYSAHVRQCAQELDTLLGKCKVGAMSRSEEVYMRLYVMEDGVYGACYEGDRLVSDDKLGKATVSVHYTTDKDPDPAALAEGGSLYLSFDRGTGAMETMGTFGPADSGNYCTSIQLSNSSKTATVVLVPQTGKHYIE